MNGILSVFAFLVSLFAVFISYKAFKRPEKISAPKLAGRYTRGKHFILHIQDYSPNKNLRIDKVYYKPINGFRYSEITFDENRLPNQVPPVIEVLITENVVFNTGTIKVQTSVTNLYEYQYAILDTRIIKWYDLLKRFRYRNFPKVPA